MFNTPFKKASIFILFPLSFYMLDFLNYTRAGKIALMGFLMIGTFSSLSMLFSKYRFFKYLLTFFTIIIFLNMSFHAGLRDIFGIAQDDIMIMQTIFGTDANEIKEFLIQYKFFLLKHIFIFISTLSMYHIFVLSRKEIEVDRAKIKKQLLCLHCFYLLFILIPLCVIQTLLSIFLTTILNGKEIF